MIAKRWYWLGLIGSTALLAVAYFYFQRQQGLDPCPLCMFQRACLVGVAAMCLLGLIFKPKKVAAKLIAFGVTVFSALGLAIAGRQVWLQYLPADQVPECGPGLDFMLETFPVMEMIQSVLQGSGECAEVQWVFLGLSMPEWMVAVFLVMTVISLRLLFSRERNYFSGALGR
ncbi:MAG: disulfide bond formation protein B [Acidiferrobacterales bacterium]|nr:disulfide bond formation protein B [Acidiferrobacterales bacterium]